MKQGNVIQGKSYLFALETVKLCSWLVNEKHERVISNQLLRSGTSIGANVEEAIGGQSKKDFSNKLRISYKEARETHYWLRLLRDVGYVSQERAVELLTSCEEILKILTSILKTLQQTDRR